jgi:hypothetical protein
MFNVWVHSSGQHAVPALRSASRMHHREVNHEQQQFSPSREMLSVFFKSLYPPRTRILREVLVLKRSFLEEQRLRDIAAQHTDTLNRVVSIWILSKSVTILCSFHCTGYRTIELAVCKLHLVLRRRYPMWQKMAYLVSITKQACQIIKQSCQIIPKISFASCRGRCRK